jgi:hypothetical protein
MVPTESATSALPIRGSWPLSSSSFALRDNDQCVDIVEEIDERKREQDWDQ